jgi:transcriptional regulator with PAS, ATPase and Fis domain
MSKKQTTQTIVLSRDELPKKISIRKCKLLVVSDSLQGQEFVVDKDVFSIGAGAGNDLQLPDVTVSRHHCELVYTERGYLIRDCGSTNGTIVQGVSVTEAIMTQSTEFQLGDTKIVFCPLRESKDYNLSDKEAFGALLGRSTPMRRIFYLAEKYAPTDATILIEGETGTGKEVLAEEIHNHSKRSDKPFVVIDCAALAKELIESELFGHKKGAFTGANTDRVGAFEHANGGTVFLDEIGELSPELQPKLLRVLEKKQVRRLGSNDVRSINVRIICATNRKLENEVNAGRFREDLYFRLSVVHLDIPPLRRRKEDIPALVHKFLNDFKRPDLDLDPSDLVKTFEALSSHNWPGNVRELRNLIELSSYDGKKTGDLSALLCLGNVKAYEEQTRIEVAADRPFKEMKGELINKFEQDYIVDLLKRNDGNISRASRDADIERTYLKRLMRKYDITT